MGVSTNFYTIYGVILEKYDPDFSEIHWETKDAPFALFGEEDMVFGVCLFDSGDMRWGFENDFVEQPKNFAALRKMEKEYRKKFQEVLPQYYHYIENEEFKVFGYAHYH